MVEFCILDYKDTYASEIRRDWSEISDVFLAFLTILIFTLFALLYLFTLFVFLASKYQSR